MPHDARAVANAILAYSFKESTEYTALQMNKLVYLCHAWYLAMYETPLIKDMGIITQNIKDLL